MEKELNKKYMIANVQVTKEEYENFEDWLKELTDKEKDKKKEEEEINMKKKNGKKITKSHNARRSRKTDKQNN